MKIRSITMSVFAFVAGLLTIAVLAAPEVSAATRTWDGGGGNNNFSTAANWDNDTPLSNGDSLVFPDSAPADSVDITNDMSNLSVSGINFPAGNKPFKLSGNDLTLTGNISSAATTSIIINLNITLGADITIASSPSNIAFGVFSTPTTFNMSTFNLTINTTTEGSVAMFNSTVSGSGNFTKTGDGQFSVGQNSDFSGHLTVLGGNYTVFSNGGFGSAAGSTTIGDGASLSFCFLTEGTYVVSESITFSGNPAGNWSKIELFSCSGIPHEHPGKQLIKLAGTTHLESDVLINGLTNSTLKITGPLTGNFTIALAAGSNAVLVVESSNNTSRTPNGQQTAPPEVITINSGDDNPTLPVFIGPNQIFVINGIRGNVEIRNGGVLKGTGTVGIVTIMSGGKIAPGASPGCLNTGNLVFNEGGIYEFEIASNESCTGYDRIRVTGTVTLGNGTLSTILSPEASLTNGQTFMIIENDGDDAVSGTFAGLAEGATFEVNGKVFKISYVGGTGNDVVLTFMRVAAPDTGFGILLNNPAAIIGLSSLAAAALWLLARHRKQAMGRQ